MQNLKHKQLKIIYSIRVQMQLKAMGYNELYTMPNPQYNYLNCWVYEKTPELLSALNEIIEEGKA